MFSVEWLVDESDVIVVVRDTHDRRGQEVLKVIKGNASTVDWPAIRFKKREQFFEPLSDVDNLPDSSQRARVFFIRGRDEGLQAVSLGQHYVLGTIDPTTNPEYKANPRRGVESRLYGVTQSGELLLTISKFFKAIDDRMRSLHTPIKLRSSTGNHLGRVGDLPARYAPESFALNCDDEVYYLVVPFDTGRRDHYLTHLLTGDAAQQLYAIRELAILDDETARQAIEKAADSTDAMEIYNFDKSKDKVVAKTAADVRAAAKYALQNL